MSVLDPMPRDTWPMQDTPGGGAAPPMMGPPNPMMGQPGPAAIYGGGAPPAGAPTGPSPQQMRMMRQQAERRRQVFEERRRARQQQRSLERIRKQVVYSPVLTSPQKSGYGPLAPQLNAQRDPRLGLPVGVDVNQLSPQDQAVYQQLLAMNDQGGQQ